MDSQSGNSRNDPVVKNKGIINEDVIKPDGSPEMDDPFGYTKPEVQSLPGNSTTMNRHRS